ncbi:MAG: MFS transporter [Chloroflexi bacterium]|nr:MFS transporter [Chloroflexota bacterium]
MLRNALQIFFPGLEVRWPRTFAALSVRNYRLFFFGQLISLTGTWMQSIAQSWLVYRLTGSPLALGVVGFFGSVPVLLFSLWGGVLADRLPKRNILVIAQTGLMLQAFVLGGLTLTGLVQVWHIMLLALILGSINSIEMPTRQAFVVEMVGKDKLTNAIALNSSLFNATRIIGPAVAGVLVATLGEGPAFFINGVSFLAVIFGLLLMRMEEVPSPNRQASGWDNLREGLGYTFRHPSILTLVALMSVSSLLVMPYAFLMPIFAKDILMVGAPGLGMLMAAAGVGALIGALFLASLGDFQNKGLMLTVGNLLYPTLILVFSFSRSFPLSLLILVGAGWAMVTQNATANTLLQTIVPDHLRGRVMSGFVLTFVGMMPLGTLQAGFIANLFGAPLALGLGALLALAFSIFIFFSRPQLRQLS